MIKNLVITTLLCTFSVCSHAAKSVDLLDMNESERNKTGLYKLSEDEIKALQNWLNKTHKEMVQTEQEKNAGFKQKQQTSEQTIITRLEKKYTDVLGYNYYRLTNGQVWKQIQSGQITIKGDQQEITIEPKMMGSWLMKGDGNKGVKVKRIR